MMIQILTISISGTSYVSPSMDDDLNGLLNNSNHEKLPKEPWL